MEKFQLIAKELATTPKLTCIKCQWTDDINNYDQYKFPFDYQRWQCPECGAEHKLTRIQLNTIFCFYAEEE